MKKIYKREAWAVMMIFFVSVVIRSLLNIKFCDYNVFTDELVHVKMSSNLFHTGKLIFQGFFKEKDDFFYYLCLLPAFLFKKQDVVRNVIVIINVLLASSVVFPIHAISKRLNIRQSHDYFIMVLFVSLPEFWYSGCVLQENLFLPLIWCCIYLDLKYLENDDAGKSLFVGFLLGLVSSMLCATKDVGFVVVAVIAVGILFEIVNRKISLKNGLVKFAVYIGVVILAKMILLLIINTVLSDESSIINSLTLGKLVEGKSIAISLERIKSFGRLFLSYLINIVLVAGVLPVIFTTIAFEKFNDDEKRLYVFAVLMILFTSFIISGKEYMLYNLSDFRVHYRYIFYVVPIFWVLYSRYTVLSENQLLKSDKIKYLVFSAIYIAGIFSIEFLPDYREINFDAPSLNMFSWISLKYGYLCIRVYLVAVLFIGMLGLLKKKYGIINLLLVLLLISANRDGNVRVYQNLNIIKNNNAIIRTDALIINQFLQDASKSSPQCLIIGENTFSDNYLECYFEPAYYKTYYDEYQNFDKEESELTQLSVYQLSKVGMPKAGTKYKYVISSYPVGISGYTHMDIGLQKFYLYQKKDKN